MPLVLTKRLVQGTKLTPSEVDQNWTDIENAINGFAAQLAAALNPNGTIKDGAVSTNSIQDRAVTRRKLDQQFEFYAVDTGIADHLVVTFTPHFTAYKEGQVIYVKALNTNTGVTTLDMDLIALRPVKKFTGAGMVDLGPGDIQALGVYAFVDDGTEFILLNPTVQTSATGPQFLPSPITVYSGGAVVWTKTAPLAGVPAGAKAVILQHKIRWATSTDGDGWIYMKKNALGFALFVGRSGAIDGLGTASGGQVFPVDDDGTDRTFYYQVTETTPGAVDTVEIDVIGFFT